MSNGLFVYRSSKIKTVLFLYSSMILALVLMLNGWVLNILGVCLSFFTVYIVFMSKKVIATSDIDISQTHYEKTVNIKWTEIGRIMDFRLGLKIYNHNENEVITMNVLLDKYSEVRNLIIQKRPDLID